MQTHRLEVHARIPDELSGLRELAGNLVYAWDRKARGVFWQMDASLWEQCGHNPKIFLRRISPRRLDELVHDEAFLELYRYTMAILRAYKERGGNPAPWVSDKLPESAGPVAYFCAEYGLHESLPLYSGGLGILAGDHLKAACALGLPFVAVGLMYHQGYFDQRIDEHGVQHAVFETPIALQDLPVGPVLDSDGQPVCVTVPMAGREVRVRAWVARVGHLPLYLLDTDVDGNTEEDRRITLQLYGGDRRLRLEQELVLGIGGVRLLRALGIRPGAWHINEGHAALLILARCCEAVADGLDFDAGLEQVASSTIFTTHTPVAAGHDMFTHDLAAPYLAPYAEAMGVDVSRLMALGDSPGRHAHFNMTALGLRGARHCNGVSRIHRGVSARMEQYIWPQTPPDESPLQSVTNGVHVSTFLARQWVNLLDMGAPGWHTRLTDEAFWHEAVARMTDQSFWAHHLSLKQEMLEYVRRVLTRQYRRHNMGEAHIERRLAGLRSLGTRPLVIGFARRFATYKRATLLLRDPERLARLLNDPDHPVVLLFAGKAHPADEPGKALIRQLCEASNRPEFGGRLFVLENYDLALSRKLVTGVDVWLNTPVYPMEACGTSGQKAAMNGALNVSVLDGWWAEGYDGINGWAVTPRATDDEAQRDANEAEDLYDIFEDEVVPLYYDLGELGYSPGWVARCKAAMSSIIPRFNAERMLRDYVDRLYAPALQAGQRLATPGAADELAQWKRRVRDAWGGVRLTHVDGTPESLNAGDTLHLRVDAELNGLSPDDVRVESVFRRIDSEDQATDADTICYRFEVEADGHGRGVYTLELPLSETGEYTYRLRAYPSHPGLVHPLEVGLMLWL